MPNEIRRPPDYTPTPEWEAIRDQARALLGGDTAVERAAGIRGIQWLHAEIGDEWRRELARSQESGLLPHSLLSEVCGYQGDRGAQGHVRRGREILAADAAETGR